MSTNRIALFFCLIGLLTVFPSSFAGQDCTCGSDCFRTNDTRWTQAYEDVERIIKRIRVGNFLAFPQPDSTIIHFDGTPTSFDGFLFQKRLAAIAALQLPIDKSCHPALVITYFHWGSLSMVPRFSRGCMDQCSTASYIDEFIPFLPTPAIPTNPLSTSCLLAPLVATAFRTCNINTGFGSHQIAFMNDDIQTPPFPCFASNARTAVKMAPLSSPQPAFESSAMNSIEAFVTPERAEASRKILECIESKCCGNKSNTSTTSRFRESKGTLFIQKSRDLNALEVDLSQNTRAREMSMKSVIEGVAMKEELSFISKEHPRMLKSTMRAWNGMEKESESFKRAMQLAKTIDEDFIFKPRGPTFSPRSE